MGCAGYRVAQPVESKVVATSGLRHRPCGLCLAHLSPRLWTVQVRWPAGRTPGAPPLLRLGCCWHKRQETRRPVHRSITGQRKPASNRRLHEPAQSATTDPAFGCIFGCLRRRARVWVCVCVCVHVRIHVCVHVRGMGGCPAHHRWRSRPAHLSPAIPGGCCVPDPGRSSRQTRVSLQFPAVIKLVHLKHVRGHIGTFEATSA